MTDQEKRDEAIQEYINATLFHIGVRLDPGLLDAIMEEALEEELFECIVGIQKGLEMSKGVITNSRIKPPVILPEDYDYNDED